MDFLVQFLASLFSKFKLKNPAVAAVVLFSLSVIQAVAYQGGDFGIFALPVWAVDILKYVSTFLMLVTGSQTWQYLQPDKRSK